MKRLVGFKICKTHHYIVMKLYVLMYVNMFATTSTSLLTPVFLARILDYLDITKKKYNKSLFIWFRNLDPCSPLNSVGDNA